MFISMPNVMRMRWVLAPGSAPTYTLLNLPLCNCWFYRMKLVSTRFALSRALCLAMLAVAVPARAGLGQPIANAAADGSLAGGIVQLANGVQQQQLLSDQATTITEYAAASGTVFAVTWRGPAPPDLRQLLGATRFTSLRHVAPQGGLHSAGQSGPDVELRMAGAMRSFVGLAWAPSLLPAGFDISSLQP